MSDTELLPKSNAGSVAEPPIRRVEVFTGTGRRRRWTPEQKALIVAETYETSETVSAVARRHGLTAQQLFTWRRSARQARAGESRIAFAPVVLETSGSEGVAPSLAQGGPGGSRVIEIVIGAATVRIPPGIELATLQLVLRAVATTAS